MPNVNQYFDNKVTSIAFQTASKPATVGVMEVGEYEFSTSEFETMTVVSGKMCVQLPADGAGQEWQTIMAGQTFTIAAKKSFKVSIPVETAYLCLYGE